MSSKFFRIFVNKLCHSGVVFVAEGCKRRIALASLPSRDVDVIFGTQAGPRIFWKKSSTFIRDGACLLIFFRIFLNQPRMGLIVTRKRRLSKTPRYLRTRILTQRSRQRHATRKNRKNVNKN